MTLNQIPICDASDSSVQVRRAPLISIVTPALNEAENVMVLYRRLCETMEPTGHDWEWIVIDDHSSDATFDTLAAISAGDDRVRVLRFSRNFGAHTALICGFAEARGDCAIVLAADLQHPPETIPRLVSAWREGAQTVWAVRSRREGETASRIGFANLYYLLMRRIVGMRDMPSQGADFFLIGRCVIDALGRFRESNVSVMALITWMGFRQESIVYDRPLRTRGRSGWTLAKKLKLVVDSITSFSYLPIRMMSLLGVLFAIAGLTLAVVIVVERLVGIVVAGTGYAALMTVLLLGFGFIMTFLGILGEYVWRTFDEARGRPRFVVERAINLREQNREQDNPAHRAVERESVMPPRTQAPLVAPDSVGAV